MITAEKTILQALRNGDKDIFKTLFEKYSTSLFYYASKFIKDDDAARDIVQEVFLSVWIQRKDLHITTSFNSYLFGVTRNKSLKLLQKQKQMGLKTDLPLSEIQFYHSNSNAINSLIEKELMGRYEEALKKLPPKCLEVFMMSRQEGLKNKEIASQLSLSEKTVEKHISKALKHLKIELKDYLPLLAFIGQLFN